MKDEDTGLRAKIYHEIDVHYPMASEASKDYTTSQIYSFIESLLNNIYKESRNQAEISFKLGIKEVVECVESFIPLVKVGMYGELWQAKLKEWEVTHV